jgi:cystathionine beta-synthase
MARYENILQAIGHTPLVRLRRIGADAASPIYAKVESLNLWRSSGSLRKRYELAGCGCALTV